MAVKENMGLSDNKWISLNVRGDLCRGKRFKQNPSAFSLLLCPFRRPRHMSRSSLGIPTSCPSCPVPFLPCSIFPPCAFFHSLSSSLSRALLQTLSSSPVTLLCGLLLFASHLPSSNYHVTFCSPKELCQNPPPCCLLARSEQENAVSCYFISSGQEGVCC